MIWEKNRTIKLVVLRIHKSPPSKEKKNVLRVVEMTNLGRKLVIIKKSVVIVIVLEVYNAITSHRKTNIRTRKKKKNKKKRLNIFCFTILCFIYTRKRHLGLIDSPLQCFRSVGM